MCVGLARLAVNLFALLTLSHMHIQDDNVIATNSKPGGADNGSPSASSFVDCISILGNSFQTYKERSEYDKASHARPVATRDAI